ncbi:PREDICTED: metaxin-1-like [Rhagoletis zephyria]|uniref:metaxin-1-like n=1 Tax=Rhagoletis zephyria TaxID=28612 RepID=UPI0008114ABC|nr:PREDICTED: metaxin-1-like [Rhagoletis zephyria]
MEEFDLYIFPGDFGLPSLDRDCLLTLVYCRLAGIPVKVHHQTNLYLSKVPALKAAHGATIYGSTEIIEYFERKNYGLETSQQQKLELWSYKTILSKKLDPCLQYFWWYDIENYNQFLNGWYAKRLPFPTNFFIPKSMRNTAIAKLESQFSHKVIESETKEKTIENQVINDARYCLNLIMEKLGDNNFLFGDKPTLLDAKIFSYLALLYKVPSKKLTIQNYIAMSDPLKKYVDRIVKSYFSGEENSSKSPFDNTLSGDSGSSIKWIDVAYSAAFASVLMVYYAVSNGILNIKESDEEEMEDELPVEEEEEEQ